MVYTAAEAECHALARRSRHAAGGLAARTSIEIPQCATCAAGPDGPADGPDVGPASSRNAASGRAPCLVTRVSLCLRENASFIACVRALDRPYNAQAY